jgi:hypothetical protein
MKNKILPILSMLIVGYFLIALVSTLDMLGDDCYFGNGQQVRTMEYAALALTVFNAVILITQCWVLIKNKQSKYGLLATAISLMLFVFFMYKFKILCNQMGD